MPREMTAKEQRYWQHALEGDPLIGNFLRNQGFFEDPVKRAMRQPICARCERFAFFFKNGAMCPTCGHFTPNNTYKLKDHLKGGGYK